MSVSDDRRSSPPLLTAFGQRATDAPRPLLLQIARFPRVLSAAELSSLSGLSETEITDDYSAGLLRRAPFYRLLLFDPGEACRYVRLKVIEQATLPQVWKPRPKEQKVRQVIDVPFTADGGVYFLRAGDRVKIGWASSVRRRARELQGACPDRLVLAHFVPATGTADGRRMEREFHRRFAACRVRGEWFNFHPVIEEFVQGERARSTGVPPR